MPEKGSRRPPRVERVLDILPPYLDGYEAICGHLARGDTDSAFELAHHLTKSARLLRRELLEIFELLEIYELRHHRKRKRESLRKK